MNHYHSVQFSTVAQSCPTLCDPMNRRTPGLPVHHQLPESTQTHVHWVGVAIQPSHPLSSPSPPALNLSQHQGLFKSLPLQSYNFNCKKIKAPIIISFIYTISISLIFFSFKGRILALPSPLSLPLSSAAASYKVVKSTMVKSMSSGKWDLGSNPCSFPS